MSVLVTGGTGFIGSQVVRTLIEGGERDVAVFDINPSTKNVADLEGDIEFIKGDLGNFAHVLDAVKSIGPTTIYHIGGMLSVPSDADPAASFRSNAMGTYHILEAARLFEVPQVLFSSTTATYGYDIQAEIIDDTTLQRPSLFYGCTKVFGEHMGLFYKRKYGLDYRGVRYPSVIGPGVKTRGIAQYTSWMIEESAKGNPFTVWVRPETRIETMYFKDAALAIIQLGKAPLADIKMVNYGIAGATPVLSANELADVVKEKLPGSAIDFVPDSEIQTSVDALCRPTDDSFARNEWNWSPTYDYVRIVADFLEEIRG